MNFNSYLNKSEQALQLAKQVAAELTAAIQLKSKAVAAFAGGTTPVLFFQALAEQAVDWQKVIFTLTDERQVASEHERSNALLLTTHLLKQLNGKAQFQALYKVGQTPDDLRLLEQAFQANYLPLDVVVLGMGNDGHFASLFPQAANLAQGLDPKNPSILLEVSSAELPEARISLSLAALLTAKHLHLLITGLEKKQLLDQALLRVKSGQPRQWPIEALLAEAGDRLIVHYAP